MKIRDIFIIIALLLVLGVAVTMVVFINKSEATTADETTAAMTTEKLEETSASTVATTAKVPDYVIRESGVGYKTIDNTTYFFKYLPDDGINTAITYYGSDFGELNNVFRYSYDLKTFDLSTVTSTPGWYQNFIRSDGIYISYCSITGCSDPNSVLDILESNVFLNKTYFDYYYSGLG